LLFAREKLSKGLIDDYAGGFLVLQRIINASQQSKDTVAGWFRKIKDDLVHSSTTLIQGIIAEMEEALQSNNPSERFANVYMGYKHTLTSLLKFF